MVVLVLQEHRLGGGKNLQLRVETFNVFNARVYGGPNTNPTSANFGIVDTASQVNFPRTIQLGARLMFYIRGPRIPNRKTGLKSR